MPSLRELQQSFARDLLADGAESVGPHLVSRVFTGERLLKIYRNNTYLSLTDALKSSYPVISRLVGDGFFRYLAHKFVDRHPPKAGALLRFGAELAPFLEQFEPARQLPYLRDVARLEWAWDEVFHEADHAPFEPDSIAHVPIERYGDLRFRLHPATRLLSSQWPVASIWLANQEDADEDEAVDLSRGAERVLISRPGLDVSVHRLEVAPYELLLGIAAEKSLSEALVGLGEKELNLDVCLQTWVAHGVIVEAAL